MQIKCNYDELVPLNELIPHPKNRNKHPKEQVKRLAEILEYQGIRIPIRVSRRSGYITAGHGRLQAAKLIGWSELPVSYQDYDSDEQEYADIQSDNSIASWSELDLSGINNDLSDLDPSFDLNLLGIKNFSLDLVSPQMDEKKKAKDKSKKITECPHCGFTLSET